MVCGECISVSLRKVRIHIFGFNVSKALKHLPYAVVIIASDQESAEASLEDDKNLGFWSQGLLAFG